MFKGLAAPIRITKGTQKTRWCQERIIFKAIFFNNSSIDELEKYISLQNFTITKELKQFSELQCIQNDYLSLTQNMPDGYELAKISIINKTKFTIYIERYIVKGFEGKYLSLSKGDRTFVKNFMDGLIKDGVYKITVKETLPLYKQYRHNFI